MAASTEIIIGDARALVSALRQVVAHASSTSARPILETVLFKVGAKTLTLVAADGFSLAQVVIDADIQRGGKGSGARGVSSRITHQSMLPVLRLAQKRPITITLKGTQLTSGIFCAKSVVIEVPIVRAADATLISDQQWASGFPDYANSCRTRFLRLTMAWCLSPIGLRLVSTVRIFCAPSGHLMPMGRIRRLFGCFLGRSRKTRPIRWAG